MEGTPPYGKEHTHTVVHELAILERIINEIKPSTPMVTASAELYREVLHTRLKAAFSMLLKAYKHETEKNDTPYTQISAF